MEIKSPFLLDDMNDNTFLKSFVLTKEGLLMKAIPRTHKYIKRTGTPGNYEYWYKSPGGKLVKGPKPGETKGTKPGKAPEESGKPQQKRPGEKPQAGTGTISREDHIKGLKYWVHDISIAESHGNTDLSQKGRANIERVMKQQGIKPEEIGYQQAKPAAGGTPPAGSGTQAAAQPAAGTEQKPAEQTGGTGGGEKPGQKREEAVASFSQEEWDKITIPAHEIRHIKKNFGRKKEGLGIHKTIHDLKTLKGLITQTKFAFISAGPNGENPKEKGMDKGDEFFHKRHDKMKQELAKHGYVFTDCIGCYDGLENSFYVMVHDSDRKDIMKLGKQFGQQSVLFSEKGEKNELIRTTPAFEGVEGSDNIKKEGAVLAVGKGYGIKPDADNYYTQFNLPSEKKNVKMGLELTEWMKSLFNDLDERLSLMKGLCK